ncbi:MULTISPECIES: Mu transposase C-terminal domain-containing protein [unclassified Streptomyces]|uniref:Mu transposase C-terminal domain-containing protein n=1 Tax=unclassified Streptomyces TaxID=2593676 RepID=UPI002E17C7D1|nr:MULTISPECIES: Mu transposase C-terminal domain-containing protein [unclassified Streptomyces]
MPDHDPRLDETPLRVGAVANLLDREANGTLTPEHKKVVAQAFRRSVKTIERWMDNARQHDGHYTPQPRTGLRLTPHIHDALARWCGSIAAAHRELLDNGHLNIPHQDGKTYSYATLRRVIQRELDPGHLAGLKGGEAARRRHDVHNTRLKGNRNDAWEGDHKTADVEVTLNNTIVRPVITWFVDCSSDGICGLAITPHAPSRDAILVALRAAILRDSHHGPFGGVPNLIRIDRGKDFLCSTVEDAIGYFDAERVDLPPRHPELKGTVEAINNAVTVMLFKGMLGYTSRPADTLHAQRRVAPGELLTFEEFSTRLLTWVHEWNHQHTIRRLNNRTPAQVWADDLTIIRDVPIEALHTFTLRAARKSHIIQGDGIHWDNRVYIADWMVGQAGKKAVVRYMPHHPHRIELTHPTTGRYLGPAYDETNKDPANPAAEAHHTAIRRAREREAEKLAKNLKKTRKSLKRRYGPVTTATAPAPIPAADAPPLKRSTAPPDIDRPLPPPTSVNGHVVLPKGGQ